jgi:hypothetical protein
LLGYVVYKYKTNFLTSVNTPFFLRQEKYMINNISLNKKHKRYIQYEMGLQRKKKFDPCIKDFIIEQRNILNNPNDLNDE